MMQKWVAASYGKTCWSDDLYCPNIRTYPSAWSGFSSLTRPVQGKGHWPSREKLIVTRWIISYILCATRLHYVDGKFDQSNDSVAIIFLRESEVGPIQRKDPKFPERNQFVTYISSPTRAGGNRTSTQSDRRIQEHFMRTCVLKSGEALESGTRETYLKIS